MGLLQWLTVVRLSTDNGFVTMANNGCQPYLFICLKITGYGKKNIAYVRHYIVGPL